MVEGDLDISGGFEWYGTVVVTGSFQFTGGAGSKNIMGAVISGGSTDGDYIGGNRGHQLLQHRDRKPESTCTRHP